DNRKSLNTRRGRIYERGSTRRAASESWPQILTTIMSSRSSDTIHPTMLLVQLGYLDDLQGVTHAKATGGSRLKPPRRPARQLRSPSLPTPSESQRKSCPT